MPNDPSETGPAPQNLDSAQEDTEAILSRRRFLIQSGLASAGLAMSGCDKGSKTDKSGAAPMDKPTKPQICLQEPRPRPDAAVSRPCLSAPPRTMDPPPPPAHPCLSPKPPPERPRPMRKATVCLSKPKPRRRKRPPRANRHRARICLHPAD